MILCFCFLQDREKLLRKKRHKRSSRPIKVEIFYLDHFGDCFVFSVSSFKDKFKGFNAEMSSSSLTDEFVDVFLRCVQEHCHC